ncbi:MFS general substrate transporter [Rhizoclosmatium globosum]|uniref:MFS general substrate transporter n=1 Tax=Rhizoclosmatium globosum TaxID=329046 RepID=A0A1Y2BQ85_9FUNG|nr:MFS general substrate transporter [Rhizoclosmatium globosum]|eukprot:ORY36912.1 MFS general substrate transporter [Rhizoclosmatium globosum]
MPKEELVIQETYAIAVTSSDLSKPVDDDPAVPLTPIQFRLVYTSLLLGVFMFSLDNAIISPALSSILGDLGNEKLLPWLGAFFLTSAPFTIVNGKLAIIFSKKYIFLAALTLFNIGSLICAVAGSMEVLILGRAIAGIGGGSMMPLSYIIIGDITNTKERTKFMSFLGVAVGLGNLLGPLLGGVFTNSLNWRWCFYINLPVGFLAFLVLLVSFNIPKPEGSILQKLKNVDFLGAIVLLFTMFAFNIPLLIGGITWAWNSFQVIVLFVLSFLGVLAFVYIESRAASDPIVPLSLFKSPFTAASIGISFFLGAFANSFIFYYGLLLEFILGYSSIEVGGIYAGTCFSYVIVTILSGAILSRKNHYISFFIIGPLFFIGTVAMVSQFTKNTLLWQTIFATLLFGIGMGAIFQLRISILPIGAPKELIPIATAVCVSAFAVGM